MSTNTDMNKKYTGVVIGCGRIGATYEIDSGLIQPASHASALAANPRTQLVALVDPDAGALAKAGEYYGVETSTDARATLEKHRPDIAVIATPPGTHEALLALALELKIPAIICEKPLSDSLESAGRMRALAEKSDSIVVLNYQRRFFPRFKEARDKIAKGALGRIQQVSCYYSNGLLNNGSHTVDALSFLLDDTAQWALGVQNELNAAAPFGTNIDGLIGFSRGTVASLQSLDNNAWGAHDFQLLGTKGALVIRQYGFRFDWLPIRDGVTFAGMNELDWENAETSFEKHSMLEATLAHAVGRLDGIDEPQSTLSDGYRTMQVLAALVESAEAGGKKIALSL